MYELDRVYRARPIMPSTFLAAVVTGGVWLFALLRLAETVS